MNEVDELRDLVRRLESRIDALEYDQKDTERRLREAEADVDGFRRDIHVLWVGAVEHT